LAFFTVFSLLFLCLRFCFILRCNFFFATYPLGF
jgi:hypothetical protein